MEDRNTLLIRLVGEASGLDLDRQAAVAYVRMEATASHGETFTDEEVLDVLPCSEKRRAKGKRRAASFSWSALSPRSKKRLVEIAVECDFDGGAMHTAMSSLDLQCDPFEASEYLKNTLGDKNKRSLELTKVGYADGGMSVRVTARGPPLSTDLVVFVIDVSSSPNALMALVLLGVAALFRIAKVLPLPVARSWHARQPLLPGFKHCGRRWILPSFVPQLVRTVLGLSR